jgi:hypothetical protein
LESQWWFFFDLKLKFPSELALATNLADRIDEAYEAAAHFNQRYSGIKSITVLGTESNRLLLILYYRKSIPEKVTAKELKIFSQFLSQNKQWGEFSTEKTKLFVPVRIIEMNWDKAQFALFNEFEHSSEDKKAEQYGAAFWPVWGEGDYGIDLEDSIKKATVSLIEDEDLSDEQLLAVLQYLIMTKDLGSIKAKKSKQGVLEEIKQLIRPWATYGGE